MKSIKETIWGNVKFNVARATRGVSFPVAINSVEAMLS
jgi:hypothetical protein